MSSPDPITIFLAIMTFISTMTGVVGTFVTYAQFKRESAARDAALRQNEMVDAAPVAGDNLATPRPAKKRIPGFSLALKSKFRMSVGFIVLAVVLALVWRSTSSGIKAGVSRLAEGTSNADSGNSEDGTVSLNDSRDFFGRALSISLNSIDLKGEPARHFSTFTVVTASGKSKRIKGEEAGFVMDFEDYNVRVVSVSDGEASFAVRKKSAT